MAWVPRGLSALLMGALWPLVASLVHADTVTDWNQTAIEVMKVASVAGNPWSRTLAMVHGAMSDAINAVQGRYTRYVVTVPAAPGASVATVKFWAQANLGPGWQAAARQLSAAKGLALAYASALTEPQARFSCRPDCPSRC